VTGRFESEDDRSAKIITSEIQPLTGMAERNAKSLWIRVTTSDLPEDAATRLYRLLEENRGDTGVAVELYHPHQYRVTIASNDFVRVKSSPELIHRIEEICGTGTVEVIN
jgi:hypothetical protein